MVEPIVVKSIDLYPTNMPLVEPLRTSFGIDIMKPSILVALTTAGGAVGWGEVSATVDPGYSYETIGTAWHILKEFLVPAVIGKKVSSPTELPLLMAGVRGHPMAKHALEAATWDASAQTNHLPLAEAFAAHLPEGHTPRGYAVVGVSIGIQPTVKATLNIIEKRLKQGYGRIKLKIKPGWDIDFAREVRKTYPDITLMLDANSAYTLADAAHLAQADDLNLLMIEQPLGHDDIYEHSKLQSQLKTAICLDESIDNVNDARLGYELGAYKIINLKPARVGGYTESLKIYQFCVEHNIPLWIGGLLETGIGRAANLAFASLPGVTLPSDISATDRYFDPDITEPPFVIGENSTIAVPSGPGIGVEVQMDRINTAMDDWTGTQTYTTIDWGL